MSDLRRSRLAEISRKNIEEEGGGTPTGGTNTEGWKSSATYGASTGTGYGKSSTNLYINKSSSESSGLGLGLGDDILATIAGLGGGGGGGGFGNATGGGITGGAINRSPSKAGATGAAVISGIPAIGDPPSISLDLGGGGGGGGGDTPTNKPSSRGRRKRPSALDNILAETEIETPQIAALSRPVSRGPREHRVVGSTVDSAELARINEEREQLRKTMLDLQKEKMAVINIASAEVEKQKVFEEEAKLALRERDELRTTLSALRAKNTWLSKTMEMKEVDAQEQRDRDRDALASELQKMEAMNKLLTQKVLDAQEEAEQRLEKEKAGFRDALRTMEAEKLQLSQRVLLTETQARKEAMTVAQQRDDFQRRVEQMKREQEQLLAKVHENEEATKSAGLALASKLAQERSELEQRMKTMEAEKKEIASALSDIESSSSAQAAALEQKLDREKEELRQMMERMESEKTSLAQNLSNAELEAQKHAQQVAEQLAKEKEALQATLSKMEDEKRELAERLSRNEQQVEVHAQQFSNAAEELSKERLAMRREMELMQRERLLLQEEMKKQQERVVDDEKRKEEKLARERDELKNAVARMKQELDLEKQQQMMLFEAAFNDENIVDYVEPAASPSLVSKKSLFDVMSDDAEAAAASVAPLERSKSKLNHPGRQINTIKEAANESDEEADTTVKTTAGNSTAPPTSINQAAPPSSVATDPPRKKMTKKASNAIIGKQNFDLPAPHTAASNGDTDELKKLWEMAETLLSSFDGFGRTPLFYAAAHDQHEAASFLVEVVPDTIFITDVHGDGPIHAAASGGSGRCIDLLVRVGQPLSKKKIVDMANNMGMVPAHLAKNSTAMEALFHHGANFQARDVSNRTPLFICAALNRSECVQFIIDNCIDGDEEALYAADSRGDTPLHAAACNGAADCLLLLLQCGINPMIENKAKLRPIDLALKNKKNKCRELLAQYHLHFATASDFDSVGFIATLEGHKMLKTAAYEIIKKADGASEDGKLKKIPSLFSLKMNKSIRLQKYGSWIVYFDDKHQSSYYYNQSTGEGQWEMPDVVKKMQDNTLSSLNSASSTDGLHKSLTSKMSMRLKKVGDWIQYSTGAGRVFYYNEKNGDFKWVTPESEAEGNSVQGAAPTTPAPSSSGSGEAAPAGSGGSSAIDAELSNWRAYRDPTTGAIFWFNKVTNVSQWECPDAKLEGQLQELEGGPGNAKYNRQQTFDHEGGPEDVRVVTTDDDLGLF